MTTVRELERRIAAKVGDGPQRRRGGTATAGVVAVAAVSIVGLALTLDRASYDVWAAFWITPLLLLACLPVARAAARAEGDEDLVRWFMGAAFMKVVVGSVVRYITVDLAYGGSDSDLYDASGAALAPAIRALDYRDLGEISGTRFVEVLTGHVYAVTGATYLGGFMVFSFLGFLGMVGFHRAFVIGFPEGDARRHRLLLFLFPAMWFWASGTGKDAWMVFCLGLAAYGLASALHGRFRGLPIAALALWGAGVVRPHVVLLFLVAVAVALLVRFLPVRSRHASGASWKRSVGAVLMAVVVGGTAVVAGAAFQEQFGLDELDVVSADEVLDDTTQRTGIGGSQFDAPAPTNPVGYLNALVTVLFRPFPFEVGGGPALLSSLEGLALLALAALALPRLLRIPGLLLRRPYVAFACLYLLGFAYAFASIENFGILARQRVQVLPLLFVLLAVRRRRVAEADAQVVSA